MKKTCLALLVSSLFVSVANAAVVDVEINDGVDNTLELIFSSKYKPDEYTFTSRMSYMTKRINEKTGKLASWHSYNNALLTPLGSVSRSDYSTQDYSNGPYINLSTNQDIRNNYGYQCVGFVKAVTNAEGTSSWVSGTRLSSTTVCQIEEYTPIATFRDGSYWGHVALFISGNSEGIWVIDQN